ncbi:MAG: sensor histidine kinase [Halobacteria archaeon]
MTNYECGCRTRNGSYLNVSVSASPLRDFNDEVNGVLVIVSDITDRKEREQRLEVLNRVLRHNLRNDLAVGIGRAEIIRDTGEEISISSAEVIKKKLEQFVEFIEKYREAEEILEREDNEWNVVDVKDTVEDVFKKYRSKYPDADMTIDVTDVSIKSKGSSGFPDIVDNLVENALKHSDSEDLQVRVTEKEAENGYVSLVVEDDGPGIPEQEKEVILSGQENALNHSSGVGLWIVNLLTKLYGGKIKFKDSELGGQVVKITLQHRRTELGWLNGVPNSTE